MYLYKKPFSKMKYVRSHYRSALTDEHLQSIFMVGNTDFEPQLIKMLTPRRFPLFSLVDLYSKFILSYYYNLNFINKNLVEI